MAFLKRLFGGRKSSPEPMRGQATVPTEETQSATRSRMGAEMLSERDRRAAIASDTSADTSASGLTPAELEEAIIALVTNACVGMNLQTTRVDVRKLEGGTVPTLRFTLDDTFSTDLERNRITSGQESAENLAREVVAELRRQRGE